MVLRALSRLPLGVLYLLGDLLFVILFYVVRYRRKVVADNLARSFPDWEESRRRQVAKRSYRWMVEVAIEALKGGSLSAEAIHERVQFKNPELLQAHFDEGRSVLLLLAHQCNWEWLILAASERYQTQMDAVYKPLGVGAINDFALQTRTRFGAHLIPMDQTLIQLMKRKLITKGFAMIADQVPMRKEEKRWVRFLGQDTAFFVGAEKIARMTKYPAVFVHIRRLKRGRYEVEFEQLAEPPYARDGFDVTDRFAEATERLVRAQPEGWLWIHRRWKYKKPFYD